MKAVEIRNGVYRVQPYYDGKRYSLCFDHVPSDAEVQKALIKKVTDTPTTSQKPHLDTSFEECVKGYIELKKDRNSPRTTKEYKNLCNHFSEKFCQKSIGDIQQLDIDKEVAAWLKKDLAYKTMKNYLSMAQTVISKFGGEKYSFDMLPEKPKKEECYIPTRDDVKKLLKYMRDNYPRCYPAFWLSTYGLRRGEIIGLTLDKIDFEKSIITIDCDIVEDSDHNWVKKDPKTQASKRKIGVSRDLTEFIRLWGKIYDLHPNSLNKALAKSQKALGITHFTLHKMRHYCCTELYEAKVSENDILAYMGWSETSDVMREVYRHFRLKHDTDKQIEIGDIITQSYAV